jgi:hypothetical protein
VRKLRVAQLRLLVPFLILGWRASAPIGDNSFLWHVRAGTVQLDAGRVLTADPFSFTVHGRAWRTQSWLVELAYGWMERITGGLSWVPTMEFILTSLAVALIGIVVYRVVNGRHLLVVLGLLILVWQSLPFQIPRPALFGYLMLALTVVFVHADRRPLWALPPLFWLWAAVHGSFPVGLGLILLDALRRRSRRQAVAAVVSGLATAFTAHGIGTWWFVLQFFAHRSALQMISEWQPPALTTLAMLPLLLVVIGLLVAAVSGRLAMRDLWIVIPFFIFGVMAQRNVWPSFMVLLPFAMASFAPRVQKGPRDSSEPYVLNWVIAAMLLVVAVYPLTRPVTLREGRFPPSPALAALDEGRLFNGVAVGGYLIYEDWPRHEVYIDDRAELYGREIFEQFEDLRAGVDVDETFDELGIDQVLVERDWPIVGYLELLGWDSRYQDEDFVVMAR